MFSLQLGTRIQLPAYEEWLCYCSMLDLLVEILPADITRGRHGPVSQQVL